ncbi:MAG: helix-turn-helix domain-containing protein [Gorillibacterium sp.]|nr:helix-turn-helix domain-containing protein [Gorillibacterium sp.]
MLKVLLVDDEKLDLSGLRQLIPWNDLDLEVVHAVNSAFAALEILSQQHIDILISDIRMPIMTGLELGIRAKELIPTLKIVFISGYEDFQYAKKAIEMEVSAYVLKPVDYQELIQVLVSLKDTIVEELTQRQLINRVEASAIYVKQEVLFQWLEGAIDFVEAERVITIQPGWKCISILEIDDVLWKLGEKSDLERAEIVSDIISYFEKEIEKGKWGESFLIENHRIALVSPMFPNELEGKLQHLVDAIRTSGPLSITIGIGRIANKCEDLPISYQQAKEAISLKMFLGKDRIIHSSEHKVSMVQNAQDLNKILEAMFQALPHYELVHIDDRLNELLSFAASVQNKQMVYNLAVFIISKLDAFLKDYHEDIQSLLGLDLKNLDILLKFETLYDIQSWLRRRLFEAAEILYNKKMKPNRKLVIAIEKYIEDNLAANVSLKDVASQFGYSPNYLGKVFKDDSGLTFSDYMTQKRLQRAKELMQNPTMKIYEIADLVGYNNRTFFNRQFKDMFGLSPSDYRRQS